MTSSSQLVQHVTLSVTCNGIQVADVPTDFELRQAWGCHDLFFLRLVVPKGRTASKLEAWPDGAAVKVHWGRLPAPGVLTDWYGYISHHEVTTGDDLTGQNIQVSYVLTGTSTVMNGDRNRTWENYTPDAIAQKIAREYSLRCVVSRSGWILKYEVQAHESDWCFLNRIAGKVGYRCWASGGTLYFIDPVVLLSGRATSAVPTYEISKSQYLTDYAQEFRILQGTTLPGAHTEMTRRVYGIDASSGQVFHTDADGPSRTEFIVNTARHVTSRAEAKRIQNAQQAMSQFWLPASCTVFGTPILYPGKSVNIYGGAIPDKKPVGWIVTAATHIGRLGGPTPDVTQDAYQTRLNIATNIRQDIPRIKGIHQVVPEMISCNLSGGKWKASTLNVIVEGTA